MQYLNYFFDVNHFYVLLFVFVMITVGIIKEHNLFVNAYGWLYSKIKNKKVLLVLFSTLAGIIPIQGRIVISTALLDTIASKDCKGRKQFGILNYLASHHYYLWSPMEKSILIPMALLSISYMTLMSYIWPILLAMLLYTLWFIINVVKIDDINISYPRIMNINSIVPVLPLLIGICCIIIFQGAALLYVFMLLTIFYMWYTKTYKWKKIKTYIDQKMLWMLFFVIGFSKLVTKISPNLLINFECFAKGYNDEKWIGVILVCMFGWFLSFLMGSSGKFAGIVAMLSLLFGIQYLPLFMAVEFSGYHMAFMTHKCIPTTNKYFGLTIPEYMLYIIPMCVLLIAVGLLTTIFFIGYY